jgi:hypothetical protein
MILETEQNGIAYQHLDHMLTSEINEFIKNGNKIFTYYRYKDNKRYGKAEIFVASLKDLFRLCHYWSHSGYKYKPIIRIKAKV